jgi:hypothetical protein
MKMIPYIAQIVEKLNQKMPTFLLHLLHCNVSMLEISLEEIDQMPRIIIRIIFVCQSNKFFLMGNY